MTQALQFFQTLFGEGELPDGEHITIWTNRNSAFATSWHRTAAAASVAAMESAEGANIYFGNTTRAEGVTNKSGVKRIYHLWADVDFKHYHSEQQAADVLAGFELEPTAIVHTGGGFHAYWRLTKPLDATPANMALAESLMERLYFRLGGLDHVQNMTRVLRVPGTQNQKYKPALDVRTLALNADASYTLDKFNVVLPDLPARNLPERMDYDLTYLPPSEKEIAALLAVLPPEGWDYRDYNNILMAVHSVFPDERGVRLIQNWSPALDKRTGEDITAAKFDSYKSQGVSVGTLYHFALDHGWKPKRGPRLKLVRPGTPAVKAKKVSTYKPEWQTLLEEMPEVEPDEMPHILRLHYDYLEPVMEAFQSTDWVTTLALALYSSQFARIKYENLNLSVWMMGLAKQGVGKSIGISEMSAVYKKIAELREIDLPLFSSGTTRGLENMFAGGEDRQVLGIIDEFSGFLKTVKGDYTSGIKEAMNKIYDGQTFAHRKATESVEITRPYLALVAATTPPAWRDNADRQDTQNGFLTRFMFSLPNTVNIQPRVAWRDDQRQAFIEMVVEHVQGLANINVAVPDTPFGGDPPVLREYVKRLGLNTGAVSTVEEDANNEEELAWGRVVARAKKVASLLALMEEKPNVVGNTLLVHERHFALAIRLVHRAAAYQKRALELLGRNKDDSDAAKIVRILREKGRKGLLKSDLMKYTHLGKRQIDPLLDLLEEDGTVEARQGSNARSVVYFLAVSDE